MFRLEYKILLLGMWNVNYKYFLKLNNLIFTTITEHFILFFSNIFHKMKMLLRRLS